MDGPTTDEQRDAWEFVRRINSAWLEGHPERLESMFHDRVVIGGPEGTRYAEGKAAVIESYRAFSQQARVADYRESDGKVDVYGPTAVVSYQYDITYAVEGKSSHETGRDVLVLTKEDGRWLAVWRMIVARAR